MDREPLQSQPRVGASRARPFERGTVFRLSGWRRWVFVPLAWIFWLYLRSLRLRMTDEDAALAASTTAPRLFISWHSRSLLAPIMAMRFFDPTKVSALISPSRMAAWEVAFYEHVGFRIVRGSSSRRGIAAARELIRELRTGYDVAITPDGPSGPRNVIKRGALVIARQAQVPLVFIIPNARAAFRLKTWDRHLVPFPFSRVDVRLRVLPPYNTDAYSGEAEAIAHWYAQLQAIDADAEGT